MPNAVYCHKNVVFTIDGDNCKSFTNTFDDM